MPFRSSSRKKNLRLSGILCAWSVFLCHSFALPAPEDYSLNEALKVLAAIEKVREEMGKGKPGLPRKIEISESELNSYIAYRIETEGEAIMKELRLKLFEGNRVEGKILIDLRGRNITQFFRPQMNFYLSAGLQVENGRARLDVKQIFLEGRPIPPVFLDIVIYFASRAQHQEAGSIKDWYELPFGIKDIKTRKEKAVFFY